MDPVVDVLFRPWRADPPSFAAGDRVLFLGARAHPDLAYVAPATLVAVQPYRPWADALIDAGFEVVRDTRAPGDDFAAALVLADPHKEVTRARLGRALLAVRPGGTVWVCAAKRQGGARWAKALAELAGEAHDDVKARCRVAWATRTDAADLEAAAAWAAEDAPRDVLDGAFRSRPGVFGWDRVDQGSALLATHLPDALGPHVVDAGGGYGWLAAEVLSRVGVRTLDVLEADARAVACAEHNLASRAGDRTVRVRWVDATLRWPVHGVDAVVTNPPFHEGGIADRRLGEAFLQRAHEALRPDGVLWTVANRHLPYERVIRDVFGASETVAAEGGFKVLRATR